jgi:integral membrane protein
MRTRDSFSRLFVPVSLAEGVSFLVLLLVAVPLQVFGHHQTPVQIFGMLHGLLFVAYVMVAVWGYLQRKWSTRHLLWVLLMAVLPTGAFFAERAVRNESAAVAPEPVAA